MDGLKKRRTMLLFQLRGVEQHLWEREMNRFAFENDIRIEKVQEYFTLLKKAGYLDKDDDGNYPSI